MTALKPIENRNVRAVASEKYPLNKKCAHPECNEPTIDPHHIFPRSLIKGDSWFVEIQEPNEAGDEFSSIIPHVSGLCRRHHDDLEGNSGPGHSAWIKLEDEVFNWYDRNSVFFDGSGDSPDYQRADGSLTNDEFTEVGPLNPQPGSTEGKPKRRKFQGEERRKRKTISLRVPADHEDGAAELEEKIARLEEMRGNGDKPRPWFYPISEALDYVLLNADSTDF